MTRTPFPPIPAVIFGVTAFLHLALRKTFPGALERLVVDLWCREGRIREVRRVMLSGESFAV